MTQPPAPGRGQGDPPGRGTQARPAWRWGSATCAAWPLSWTGMDTDALRDVARGGGV